MNLQQYRNEISATSSVYSADLAGSALGFILVTGVAIPALGIQASIFILSSLIFAGVLFGTIGEQVVVLTWKYSFQWKCNLEIIISASVNS